MKTKIFYCTSPYPLAPLVAGVLTGRLPSAFNQKTFRDFAYANDFSFYPQGKPVCLGISLAGEKVMAISTGTASINPDNIISGFLTMYGLGNNQYSLVEVTCRERFWLLLGRFMMGISFFNNPGKLVIEWRIKKIYPDLVERLCS